MRCIQETFGPRERSISVPRKRGYMRILRSASPRAVPGSTLLSHVIRERQNQNSDLNRSAHCRESWGESHLSASANVFTHSRQKQAGQPQLLHSSHEHCEYPYFEGAMVLAPTHTKKTFLSTAMEETSLFSGVKPRTRLCAHTHVALVRSSEARKSHLAPKTGRIRCGE